MTDVIDAVQRVSFVSRWMAGVLLTSDIDAV